MICEQPLRTGAWYGDRPLHLDFPPEWDVTFLWPKTPPPLTDHQIVSVLERPVGQPPIRQMCRGKSCPLIIVDDLNRPTPAARVMPFLLKCLQDSGVPSRQVRILVASGSHGRSPIDAVLRKVGPEAASCQIIPHDCSRDVVKIGRTSFGTPVFLNKEVVASDFILGIGGVYPNHTAGFGGGSKLALGVLGLRSIMHLHYRHQSVGWGSCGANGLRRDLDDIAKMIGLNTLITMHVNADREVVRVYCGDHFMYYRDAVAFSKRAFSAPLPEDADVVISNAYPEDLSLTFVRMKGIQPLRCCAPGASRIVIASCSEGLGYHRLFPFMPLPRFHSTRTAAQRISVMRPQEFGQKLASALDRRLRTKFAEIGNSLRRGNHKASAALHPLWLYRPQSGSSPLPSRIPSIRLRDSWQEIVQAVQEEQGERKRLKVVVYPCAPLQCLDPSAVSQREFPAPETGEANREEACCDAT